MSDSGKDSEQALTDAIGRYNDAWNAHDLDAIMAMHAPDMVFENHTAGESASGEAVRGHIATIFENWPDLTFASRRLYVREGVVVQEWTARGRELEWDGVDVIPFERGLVKRKDVYSASGSARRQAGIG
jgi:hypothetical protein